MKKLFERLFPQSQQNVPERVPKRAPKEERVGEMVKAESPEEVVSELIALVQMAENKEAALALIKNTYDRIRTNYQEALPDEPLPKGLTPETADQSRLRLLEHYDIAAGDVDDSAEQAMHRLQTTLALIFTRGQETRWTHKDIVQTLEDVREWYKKHAPRVIDLMRNNNRNTK